MTLLKVPIAFIISILFTQAVFAGPIYVSLEALTKTTILEGDEGRGNPMIVRINLSEPSEEVVQVRLFSSDHDAIAGVDYEEFDEIFTFQPGEVLHVAFIRTIPNIIDNPYERKFMLMLKDPVGAKLADPVLIITILDDDEVLRMESTSNVLEKDKGEVSFIDVVVKREFDNEDEPVYFDLKTKDGSAVAGLDYESESFEGVLLPGEFEKTFRFTVIGDDEFEEYELFYIDLIPRSESTRVYNSPLPIYIMDNDGDFYFSYELEVKASPKQGEFIIGRTSGDIALKRLVDEEGRISYEGESVITHTDFWNRIGYLPTQPSRTRAKFYGINNDLTPDNVRVEWGVGPDEHLRCSMPPPMGMPMNCIWWAGMVNYHMGKNWTPAKPGKWGTFLLKGFEQFNRMESKEHVIALKKDMLNYTLPGPTAVEERGTYKIIRKAR